VTPSQPIAAGAYLAIFCTGLGAVTPAAITGALPASPVPQTTVKPSVLIDGQPVNMLWAGLAPGFVGLYQVNAQVPATLTAGAHQLQLVGNVRGSLMSCPACILTMRDRAKSRESPAARSRQESAFPELVVLSHAPAGVRST
jgi:hypothetical protein